MLNEVDTQLRLHTAFLTTCYSALKADENNNAEISLALDDHIANRLYPLSEKLTRVIEEIESARKRAAAKEAQS